MTYTLILVFTILANSGSAISSIKMEHLTKENCLAQVQAMAGVVRFTGGSKHTEAFCLPDR